VEGALSVSEIDPVEMGGIRACTDIIGRSGNVWRFVKDDSANFAEPLF
jgi:hypothetical protein